MDRGREVCHTSRQWRLNHLRLALALCLALSLLPAGALAAGVDSGAPTTVTVKGETKVGPDVIVYVPTSIEGTEAQLELTVTAPSGLTFLSYYSNDSIPVELYDPWQEINEMTHEEGSDVYTCTIPYPVGEFFNVMVNDEASEEPTEYCYMILWKDETPPTAVFDMDRIEGTLGEDGWYTSNVKLYVDVNDPWVKCPDDPDTKFINESDASGIKNWEYSLNGCSWKTSYSEGSFPITSNGEYTVRLRATDNQGNVSDIVETTVKIDQNTPVAPTVTAATELGSYTSGAGFTARPVTLTAVSKGSGNVSGVGLEYKLSTEADTEWKPYAAPVVHQTNTGDEGVTYQFRAVSGAGKPGAVKEFTVKYRVLPEEVLNGEANIYGDKDIDPGTLPGGGDPYEDWWTVKPTVTVTPKEEIDLGGGEYVEAKTYYMLYKAPATTGTRTELTSDWKINVTGDGIWTLELWTEDAAGNETAHLVRTFHVDTAPPIIRYPEGNPTAWINQDAAITASAYDHTSGMKSIEVTCDDGEAVARTEGSFTADRSGTYTITATDNAGNAATRDVGVTKIDKTPPTLTWTPEIDSVKWYGATTLSVAVEDDLDAAPTVTLQRDGETFDGKLTETGISVVTAVGLDAAGNETVQTKTVQIETKIDEFTAMVDALSSESAYTAIVAAKVWYDGQSDVIKGRFSKSDDVQKAYDTLMGLLRAKAEEAAEGVTEAIQSADTIGEIEQAAKDYAALPDEARDMIPVEVEKELKQKEADADAARKVIQQLANADREKTGKDPGGSYEEKQAALDAYGKLTEAQKALVDQVADAVTDKESITADLAAIDHVLDLLKDIKKPYTPGTKEQIKAAGDAYATLTQEQKDAFPKADKDRLDALEEMRQHAQSVESQIGALGDNPSMDALISAKGACDALTADEKAMVTGADELNRKYQTELEKLNKDEKAAAEFAAKVEEAKNAPTVEKIEELIKNHDALSDAAKGKLTDQTKTDYEKLVEDLNAAAPVIDKLDAIDVGTLTPDDMDKVKEALDAYDKLTEDQRKLADEATDGKAGTLKDAVDTVKDATDKIEGIPSHGDGTAVGEGCPGSTGGPITGENHTYEEHRGAIEEAKIAYERLTDAGRKLISADAKDKLNREYAALMAYLEYINTARTATTNVEVAGLAEKVELPTESASAPKTVISVVMADSRPDTMPPVPTGKIEALSVDVKLVASIFDDPDAAEAAAVEQVQPKPGEAVLVKLKVPSGYKNDTLELWHVRDSGGRSRIEDFWLVTEADGTYAVFEVSSFSHFVFFAEKEVEPPALVLPGDGVYSGGSSAPEPVITDTENGSLSVMPGRPKPGETVIITPRPDEGYAADKVTVTDQSGNSVPVRYNGDGTWSYTQPNGKVTVTVTFKPGPQAAEWPITDVNPGDWIYESER